MSYDNEKQVIVSKVHSDNPKAPGLRVEVEINGQKYQAGLWHWQKKDGSFVTDKQGAKKYIGKLEVDTYGQEAKQPEMKPAETTPVQDDVPF